jgi:Zn-dependent protease with chaperone function
LADSIWAAYFSSIGPLAVLTLIYTLIAALWLVYRSAPERPSLRLKAAFGVILLSASSWTFLGASLVLCQVYSADYLAYVPGTVSKVFGLSTASAGLIGGPLALGLWILSPRLALARLQLKPANNARLLKIVANLKPITGLGVKVLECETEGPVALAVEGCVPAIVVSGGLTELLDDQELEAVLAHEVAHIKARDTWLKLFATCYRRLFPFDPIILMAEAAIHRETELRADEMAARTTGKPLALASALLKIHELGAPRLPLLASSLLISYARGVLRMSPPLKLRIERLLKMAETMRVGMARESQT